MPSSPTVVSAAPPTSCGGSVRPSPLSATEASELASVLKAVAEPTRLRLLGIVAGAEGSEACICDLTEPVGLSQPTVSHHMKILVDAGLLVREQRGKWAYYRLVEGTVPDLARTLMQAVLPSRRDGGS